MNKIEQAVAKQNEMLCRARTPCGIEEGYEELNNANRAVIEAMKDQYGEAYLVSVNTDEGIRRYEDTSQLTNFCCDWCSPYTSEKLKRLIRTWRASSCIQILTELHQYLSTIGAKPMVWS